MSYSIRFTREAERDVRRLSPKLKAKLKQILLSQIAEKPYNGKRLVGDLSDFYSARLTYGDRIVYSVDESSQTVFVHRARTHYGE